MILRKNCWLIGQSDSESLSRSIRLPTNKAVLARYVHLRSKFSTETTRHIFKKIFIEMRVVWEKAGVPLKPDRMCVEQLLCLFKHWEIVKKLEKKNRTMENGTSKSKIDKFEEELNQLCDISAKDAYEKLSQSRRPNWKEDYSFLENQRGSRTFYMTQHDRDVSGFVQRQLSRKSKYQSQKQRGSECQSSISPLADDENREQLSEVSEDELEDSVMFTPSNQKRRRTAETVSLKIPSQRLSEVVASAADRSGLSIR